MQSSACLALAEHITQFSTSPRINKTRVAHSSAVRWPRRDYNAQMGDDPVKDAPVPDRLLFLPLAADRGSGQRSWLQHLVRSDLYAITRHWTPVRPCDED